MKKKAGEQEKLRENESTRGHFVIVVGASRRHNSGVTHNRSVAGAAAAVLAVV